MRRHIPEIGQDCAEAEDNLARPVPGLQRAAVHHVVEQAHTRAEHRDRAQPPPQRRSGQPRRPQPPGHQHGHNGAAKHDHVRIADEHRRLDGHEPGQPGPGAPPGSGLVGQHRPQQRPAAGRDQRGVGERRHVVTPGEQQRRARRAEQADRRRAAEAPQPPPRAGEQAHAAQRPVKQRRQPDDAQRLERRGKKRVTRILLTDPPSVGELDPLGDDARGEAQTHAAGAGQLNGQRVILGRG